MSIDKKKLLQLLDEAKKLQTEHQGKIMPEDVGKKFDALCTEAKAMQDELDREDQLKRLDKFAGEIPDPAIPAQKQQETGPKDEIAGFLTLGDYIAMGSGYKAWLEAGRPRGDFKLAAELPGLLQIPRLPGFKQGFVPLTREQRKAIEARMESKTMPNLGTSTSRVIAPDRLGDIVVDTRNDMLNLRDVLNVSPTGSNLIEWVGRSSFSRSADIVSEGASKPEAATTYTLRSTPVRDIAVHIPVSEQQLADAAQIVSLIQTDLLYDVRKVEEEQVVWCAGSGLDLDGLENNVSVGTTTGGDTLIDQIRKAITDVRTSGYEPNAVAMHPIDWETVELVKGSDGHYVWAVIRDQLGPRIWGLRVVETIAMVSGNNRIVVVGDFLRGATLWDRQQASIAVGWIDDQFIKNMRTIRAEERVAFAVRQPDAFRQIVTDS